MIGTKLGPYEVTAKLGEGGMGEVFRARDTKLEREVAIKVLPAAFVEDGERLARFEREAKLLAQLNHPNIAQIYGIEASGESHALVMELVEGPTLAERLESGSLPLDESLSLARQIAEALEEAHEKGIIHRDLKPQNVKVTTDGRVKVLDFGLAKAMDVGGSSPDLARSPTLLNSPTLTAAGTQLGVILGTAAYMAPEQAAGGVADRRADVWAFGVVLFEMLSGRRLFEGETVSHVLAGVLKDEPDFSALPDGIPSRILRLLRRCLHKKPKQRLHSIADARIVIDEVLAGEGDATVPTLEAAPATVVPAWRRALPWAVAALALAAAVASVLGGRSPSPASALSSLASIAEWRTSLALPDGVGIPTLSYFGASRATLALSPRGDLVAFVGLKDEERGALYLRRFDSFDAVRLTKTEGAMAPFFSPDGTQLAFFGRRGVWRVDLPDGVPVELTSTDRTSVGGSWSEDGRIVYAPSYSEALWTIPAAGGEARQLTTVDRAKGEVSHRWPYVLPGGAGVLFTIKMATSETLDDALIAIADPRTGEHRVLVEGGSMPRYLDDGRLVFARAGKLYAAAFDLASRQVRGAPVSVLDGVATVPTNGVAFYDVTRDGLLAYVAGGPQRLTGRYAWEGPGRPAQLLERLDPKFSDKPRLSHDFKQAVVGVGGANDKLWLIDLEQMNATPLTSGGGNDSSGVISPDGRWLLFSSDRAGGGYRCYRMPLGGSAAPEPLLDGQAFIQSISYPARMLGFTLTTEDGADAYVVPIAADGKPTDKPVLVSPAAHRSSNPTVSPDGTLVAYLSWESGRAEVYVARLADLGARRRLTNDGGGDPLWNRDGSRLFYSSNGRVVSQTLRSASELRFDAPQVVSGQDTPGEIVGFDVAPDGSSALVGRVEDPLMLRRDIRLWPRWGATPPSGGKR